MEREKEKNSSDFLETIKRELVSIIEESSENNESKLKGEKKFSQGCNYTSQFCSASASSVKESFSSKDDLSSRSAVFDNFNTTNLNNEIQKLQNNLDESCKMFQTIGELFESINFGCIKNRIKDLHLNEQSTDSIKIIVNDLKHVFEEKYMENRLNELTKELTSKFRSHPGEFGDIPEISEFFRTCSKLDHGLEKLKQQRDDCMYLQKRVIRAAEASYDRVNVIQRKIIGKDERQQDGDSTNNNI